MYELIVLFDFLRTNEDVTFLLRAPKKLSGFFNHLLDCLNLNQLLTRTTLSVRDSKIRAATSNKDQAFHLLKKYKIVEKQYIVFLHKKQIVSFLINQYKKISNNYRTLRRIKR